jgi:hypothetical protein
MNDETPQKKPRGDRRPDVVVERDRFLLTEKVHGEGKTATEAGRELGINTRTARRLVSEGLRELIETNQAEFLELAKLINLAWVETLEEIDAKIQLQKEQVGMPSDRILMTKVALLTNLSKALGVGDVKVPDPSKTVTVIFTSDAEGAK